MDFIFELLLGAAWFLLELLGELFLQVFFEALFELGVRSIKAPFQKKKPAHPAFVAVGYTLLGGVAGALSLWMFPHGFIEGEHLRIANLVLTPALSGAAMALLGKWRARRGDFLVRLDRFGYGYIFALAMGAVRFVLAG